MSLKKNVDVYAYFLVGKIMSDSLMPLKCTKININIYKFTFKKLWCLKRMTNS